MLKVTENAYKQYIRSRPLSSSDSSRRVKKLPLSNCGIHPIFKKEADKGEFERESIISAMQNYRPHGTVFEICSKNKSQDYQAMKAKREYHKDTIAMFYQKKEMDEEVIGAKSSVNLPSSNPEDIESAFSQVILPKKRKLDDLYRTKTKKSKTKDENNYIPYAPLDARTEEGLAVNNFQNEASQAQLDLTGDTEETYKLNKQLKKWDRKKKKMVAVPGMKAGKIRTESGVWIPASYKSNRYAEWKEKAKIQEEEDNSEDEKEAAYRRRKMSRVPNTHWAKHNEKERNKQRKSELKSTDQILKMRKLQEKKKARQNKKLKQKRKNKK